MMIEYKYKKVPGYEQKKFIENGHTMFEEDVLQRLKRLAYLEDQIKNNDCISAVKHRLCTNCKYCLPNAYAKYRHDRYFCNRDIGSNKIAITSPESFNCNFHEWFGV